MTVATLYEMLDLLPDEYDAFFIRFVFPDRSRNYQCETWQVDEDRLLFLGKTTAIDDVGGIAVSTAKRILSGDDEIFDGDYDPGMRVLLVGPVDEFNEDGSPRYVGFRILENDFSINEKRRRVDVWIE